MAPLGPEVRFSDDVCSSSGSLNEELGLVLCYLSIVRHGGPQHVRTWNLLVCVVTAAQSCTYWTVDAETTDEHTVIKICSTYRHLSLPLIVRP